jgi:hypothetical protein
VATAVDALQRSIIGSGNGVGLRGGTFHTDYGVTQWTRPVSHPTHDKNPQKACQIRAISTF